MSRRNMKKSLWLLAVFFLLQCIDLLGQGGKNSKPIFRIRTITAGVNLGSISDLAAIESGMAFLERAKKEFEAAGYEVQTLRIATQPLKEYLNDRSRSQAIPALKTIDRLIASKNVILSIGPVITQDEYDPEFSSWAANLIRETNNISFSVSVASKSQGIHSQTALTAAEAIVAISKASKGGEGNFRFTASANCPPNIPFFPAAYHRGVENFAIGLESPGLLKQAFENSESVAHAKRKLKTLLESKLGAVEKIALQIQQRENRAYSGIDVSPAPGLDASIGEAIETLSQAPFGDASTLTVCAAITDILKNLKVKKCGYSGLMLPVIEDRVLAKRATEGRYTVQELLLYSSVSGTGLDVIPLPGDTSRDKLAALIEDVAALSVKLSNKPLSARLFLIPGKNAGEMVTFDNPYLTDCVVMKAD